MKRALVLLAVAGPLLVLVAASPALAQEAARKASVRGTVRDADTGEPLAGANVLVERAGGAQHGQATDGSGAYRVEALAAGRYTVRASYLGYQPAERDVRLAAGEERRLDFDLAPAPLEEEGVTITGERAAEEAERDLGAERLTPADIKRLPTILEPDVFRALQLLPGVKAASDFSSGLYIRGGSPDQTLVRLGETTVYNPTHFFGFFSAFNPDAIGDVRLFKGGFPAEYGGRLGAVVDLENRRGSTEGTSGTASVGLLASRVAVDGPLPKALGTGSSWLLSARRSTLEPLLAFLRGRDVEGIPDQFHFYDLNARADFQLSPRNRLSLSGYAGADYLDFPFLEDAQVELPYGNRTGSLRWTHLFGDGLFGERAFSHLSVAASHYFSRPTFDVAGNVFQRTNELTDLTASGDLEVTTGAHTLRGGARGGLFTVDLERRLDDQALFAPRIRTGRVAGYLQDTYRPSDAWEITAGLRAAYHTRGRYFRLAPRLSVEYRPAALSRRVRLQAGYGRYHQFLTLLTSELFSGADTWYAAGEGVPPAYGDQFVSGIKADLTDEVRLDVEGYYRTMRDLFEIDPFTRDAAGLAYADAFQFGDGYAYGLEAKLERTAGRLSGFLAYTYAQTRRRFPFVNAAEDLPALNARNALGGYYPPKYDRRHDLKLVLNYDFSDAWRATGVFTYATGQPYTQPQQQFKLLNPPERGTTRNALVSPFNGARLPAYHRLDLGVRRLGTLFGLDYELQLQLINAYNQRNIWFYFFEFEDDNTINREDIPQIPVPIPNVALTVDF